MNTTLHKEISITPRQINFLERQLALNGFKNFSVAISNKRKATISFENEAEYTIFVIKDILKKAITEYKASLDDLDFNLMVRLEKKLNSYSKADEFIIRRGI